MIGVAVSRHVAGAREAVVGWHRPHKGGRGNVGAEAQILSGIVVTSSCAWQPDAFQVHGHIYLFAGVAVVAEYPHFEELGIHAFCPHLVQYHVGLYFVGVATVYHQLVLCIQIAHRATHLAVGEVADAVGMGTDGQCGQQYECKEQLFHCCNFNMFVALLRSHFLCVS